jgi:hypothetical protein
MNFLLSFLIAMALGEGSQSAWAMMEEEESPPIEISHRREEGREETS